MTYYFLPLTRQEANDPAKTGWAYAKQNESKWVTSADLVEVNTYDRGVTHIVHNDVCYTIYKDYVDLTKQKRLYIGKPSDSSSDQYIADRPVV